MCWGLQCYHVSLGRGSFRLTVNEKKCKPPVINTPFIPDIKFFVEDPVNSFTFAEFTHTGESDAFVMSLTSSLVDS